MISVPVNAIGLTNVVSVMVVTGMVSKVAEVSKYTVDVIIVDEMIVD